VGNTPARSGQTFKEKNKLAYAHVDLISRETSGQSPEFLKIILQRSSGQSHSSLTRQRCHFFENFGFAVLEPVRFVRNNASPTAAVQKSYITHDSVI
jgi:hypothetical protein